MLLREAAEPIAMQRSMSKSTETAIQLTEGKKRGRPSSADATEIKGSSQHIIISLELVLILENSPEKHN